MKLVRFGKEGREKPGIIDEEGFLERSFIKSKRYRRKNYIF